MHNYLMMFLLHTTPVAPSTAPQITLPTTQLEITIDQPTLTNDFENQLRAVQYISKQS